jgi:molybdenum cofactor guanylyltransferase
MSLEKMGNVVGSILAGGRSRRFGRPKSFAKYNEKYFIEYSINALKQNTDRIVIVSHPSLTTSMSSIGIDTLEDIPAYQGKGPLVGILSVMEAEDAEWYAVLPCDTPKMTTSIVNDILSHREVGIDAVVPVIAGRIQPLNAIYHKRVKTLIIHLLETDNYKMKALLEMCKVKYITEQDLRIDGTEFANINNMDDFNNL